MWMTNVHVQKRNPETIPYIKMQRLILFDWTKGTKKCCEVKANAKKELDQYPAILT